MKKTYSLIAHTRKKWGSEKTRMLRHNWKAIRARLIKETFPKRTANVLDTVPDLDEWGRESLQEGYFFYGDSGNGKTIAVSRILIQHRKDFEFNIDWSSEVRGEVEKYPTYGFTTLLDFFSEIKETYKKDSPITEEEVFQKYANVDVLILDDIALEKSTEWSYATFYRLINYRHDEMKQTLYTSNKSIEEMEEEDLLDTRLLRRIVATSDHVNEKEHWKNK
jgi:DNA replication protein DnaC